MSNSLFFRSGMSKVSGPSSWTFVSLQRQYRRMMYSESSKWRNRSLRGHRPVYTNTVILLGYYIRTAEYT